MRRSDARDSHRPATVATKRITNQDTTKWTQVWVAMTSTVVDLCDQCGKAFLGWVQTGTSVESEATRA